MSRRTSSLSPLSSRKRIKLEHEDDEDDTSVEGPPRAPKETMDNPSSGMEFDDPEDQCVICLQTIVDRTVLPPCAHDRFCFECLEMWAAQSRKCPLCTTDIGPHIIHNIRSQYDFQKRHLPPLRTSPLPTLPLTRIIRSRTARDPRPVERSEWGRRRGEEDLEVLERAIEKRKWVYRHNLYAKHVASNSYTRFKPYPSPAQFASSPDLIARTTAFIRRELQVWNNLDVEFLTTFILALMKSIDIRAEAAVKLLAEFLDMDTTYTETGRKVNAEHFAHEVYTYLRSPYRELSTYDKVIQYDTPVLSRSSPPPEVRRRRHDRWIPEEEKQSRSRPYSQSRGGPSSDVGDESDTLERSPRDIHSPPRNSYREDRIHQPKYRRRRGQEVVKRDRYQERSRSPEPGPSSQRSRSRSRSRYRDQVDPLLYHGDRSPVRPDKSRRPYSPSSSSSLMHQRGRKSISPGGVAKKDDERLLPIPETLVQRFDPTGAPATTPQLMNDALPAGISIKGASKANSMQPRLAIAGLSIKGRASKEKASVTVIEHAETSTGVALPSLPGRMSDAKVEAASQKPHSYHGTSVDQAAAASVAEMMARTRTQMQAKREEEPRAGANGQADEWLTEEESSRDTTRLRRERLISRLEEERRICAAGARADEAKADSSLSMGPAGDTLSKGAPQSFNQKSALDEQEAKLRVRARLRIKLAAETRQALDRDTRNDKVRIGDAESRSKVRAVNGQVQEPDTRASLEEGLKARLKEKLSDRR